MNPYVKLKNLIDKHFDEGEIRSLCFAANIDFEYLNGENKIQKIESLIRYVERRGKLAELIRHCEASRNFVDWPTPRSLDRANLPVQTERKSSSWLWWGGAIVVTALVVWSISSVLGGSGDVNTRATITAEVNTVMQATDESNAVIQTATTEAVTRAAGAALTRTAAAPTDTGTPDPNVPPPNPTLNSIWVRPVDEMTMVYVPGGTFAMGSEDGDSNELPVHNVALDGFWVDQTEVTNAQYAECVADGVCDRSAFAADDRLNGDDQPVVGVTWYDAEAYCKWTGGRLPTEAEWEYAARGPDGKIYPWGNNFDGENLNFCDASCDRDHRDEFINDGYAFTAPVGTYPAGASWVGALDMAGNVWEWINDWYDSNYYENSPARNPQGPESGSSKVVRGGSWSYSNRVVRSAVRFGAEPMFSNGSGGFRCAQE